MEISPIVKKEFVSLFRRDYYSKAKSVANLLSSLVLNLVLVAFVVFLYSFLDSKLTSQGIIIQGPGYTAALPIFILVMTLMICVYSLITANTLSNSLYNQDDRFILRVMPLKEHHILLPKLGTMYIRILSTYAIMFLALLITFGILHLNDPTIGISWWYWPLSIFFTFITPIFILFFGVILSYPLKLLKLIINRHPIIQVIVSIAAVAVVSVVYFFVIDFFSDLINGSASGGVDISTIISTSTLRGLDFLTNFCVPVNYMIQVLCNLDKWSYFLIYVAAILICFGLVYFITMGYYHEYLKIDEKFSVIPKKEVRVHKYPLLLKEFRLMFRNSTGSLSFVVYAVCASILAAFLVYFVNKTYGDFSSVGTTNLGNITDNIFALLNYIDLPICILFMTLSISLVFSNETKLFIKEKRTASVILTIPQSFKKQIVAKLVINTILLFLSNILSFTLIASFGIFDSAIDLLIILGCSLFITFSTFFLSVGHTLSVTKSLSATNDIATTGSLNFLIALLFPIAVFLIAFGLLYLFTTLEGLKSLSGTITYAFIIIVLVTIFVLSIVYLIKKIKQFSKFLSEGGIVK